MDSWNGMARAFRVGGSEPYLVPRALLAIAVLGIILAAMPARSLGSAGDLDPTFDSDGKVTTDFGLSDDVARAVLVIPADLPVDGGKIVAAGYAPSGKGFALARYNSNGSLDSTFGTGGKIVPNPFQIRAGMALALQRSGSTYTLVVVGPTFGSSYDFAVSRYKPDGTLDASFGGGDVSTDIGGGTDDFPTAVAVQSDGKIVVAGYSYYRNRDEFDFAIVRYTTGGALDSSFGTAGKVVTNIRADDYAQAVALQPDGKILVAGFTQRGVDNDFLLVRYTASGALDSSFGGSGKVFTDFGSGTDDHAFAMALQTDGKIVVAGDSFGALMDFALARYTSSGALDTTFDGDGMVVTAISSGHDSIRSLAIQPDGKIVAAGYKTAAGNTDIALARYNSNGSLDATFGQNGTVSAGIGPGLDDLFGVALQADGRIVGAGRASRVCPAGCNCDTCNFFVPQCAATDDFAVLRFLGN